MSEQKAKEYSTYVANTIVTGGTRPRTIEPSGESERITPAFLGPMGSLVQRSKPEQHAPQKKARDTDSLTLNQDRGVFAAGYTPTTEATQRAYGSFLSVLNKVSHFQGDELYDAGYEVLNLFKGESIQKNIKEDMETLLSGTRVSIENFDKLRQYASEITDFTQRAPDFDDAVISTTATEEIITFNPDSDQEDNVGFIDDDRNERGIKRPRKHKFSRRKRRAIEGENGDIGAEIPSEDDLLSDPEDSSESSDVDDENNRRIDASKLLEHDPNNRTQSRQATQRLHKELESFRKNIHTEKKKTLPDYTILDLDSLRFADGQQILPNARWSLPAGSQESKHKGYDQLTIPAPAPVVIPSSNLKDINAMPQWAQPAFDGVSTLNRIQSIVHRSAFEGSSNLLVCAPTGAGKTNIAMLTFLHEIGKHLIPSEKLADTKEQTKVGYVGEGMSEMMVDEQNEDEPTVHVDLDSFKIVYIAPMKSLVQEMVRSFSYRLKPYGMNVKELSGDAQLSRQQLSETHVIVTTPEKWDIVTRKAGDRSVTEKVSLVVIDEIHLLHDQRGPVLESIISRTMRMVESSSRMIRIVGLSATLPNYLDIAELLRCQGHWDSEKNSIADAQSSKREPYGCFHFHNNYRPVPLQQTYFGITETKGMKKAQTMNALVYETVQNHVQQSNTVVPLIVFVHSRQDTVRTAEFIFEEATKSEDLLRFMNRSDEEFLAEESEKAFDPALKKLIKHGIGVHHAGLPLNDRQLVEGLFADFHLSVLVSTATLAWGVNLPAHAVIIKGTQVYSPEKSSWVSISPMDLMQMLGRAGRPQYDTYGEGTVITSRAEMQFFLYAMNEKLPIESQMISRLTNHVNAEIVLGNITNVEDCVDWLLYTYLSIRMSRNPTLYGLDYHSDPSKTKQELFEQMLWNLSFTALIELGKAELVVFDRNTGIVKPTELGRIASYFYITPATMTTFAFELKPTLSDAGLFRVFALSSEFEYMGVRVDERDELATFLQQIPIPIKEQPDDPIAKTIVLLQAHISRLPLVGSHLHSDMVYIKQNAARIFRALFELALRRRIAPVTLRTLQFAKSVQRQMWGTECPLRQCHGVPQEAIRRFERSDTSFEFIMNQNESDLSALLSGIKEVRKVTTALKRIPRLQCGVKVVPLTASLIEMSIDLLAVFTWDEKYHGRSELFWVFVLDGDGERILHSECISITERNTQEDYKRHLTIQVKLLNPLPPQYFLNIVSDRWICPDIQIPIPLSTLIVPEPCPPPLELGQTTNLVPSELSSDSRLMSFFSDLPHLTPSDKSFKLNPLQAQVFGSLFNTDDHIFLAAPAGSGNRVCIDITFLRGLISTGLIDYAPPADARAKARNDKQLVYVGPTMTRCRDQFLRWKQKLSSLNPHITISLLTGDLTTDGKLMTSSQVIIAPFSVWDSRMRSKLEIRTVQLLIIDGLHYITEPEYAHHIESLVARARMSNVRIEGQFNERRSSLDEEQLAMFDRQYPRPPQTRIVAFSYPVMDAESVSGWLGVKTSNCFNFSNNSRPIRLNLHLSGYDFVDSTERQWAMNRPCFNQLKALEPSKQAIVTVPGSTEASNLANDLISHAKAESERLIFIGSQDHLISTLSSLLEKINAPVPKPKVEPTPQQLRSALLMALLMSDNPASILSHSDRLEDRVCAESLSSNISSTYVLSSAHKDWLISGIGVIDEGMTRATIQFVRMLYRLGILRVIIVTNPMIRMIPAERCSTLIIANPVIFDSASRRHVPISTIDLLTTLGLVGTPGIDKEGSVHILSHVSQKEVISRSIESPLSLESALISGIDMFINRWIACQHIAALEETVQLLTWTYLSRRMVKNPHFYNVRNGSVEEVSNVLSSIVEDSISRLCTAGCMTSDEVSVGEVYSVALGPLNYGVVASYYNMSTVTMGLFVSSLGKAVRAETVLLLLCSATEFDDVPVRLGEPSALARLAKSLRLPSQTLTFDDPHTKMFVLVHAHFQRKRIPRILSLDLCEALPTLNWLTHAAVDILSSLGGFGSCLAAMELAQMIIQGLWRTNMPSELIQIPFVTSETAGLLAESGIKTFEELSSASDKDRELLISKVHPHEQQVIEMYNRYVDFEVNHTLLGSQAVDASGLHVYEAGSEIQISVVVSRTDTDDEEQPTKAPSNAQIDTSVYCPKYPSAVKEGWWVVVANLSNGADECCCLKQSPLDRELNKITLQFTAPQVGGEHHFSLFVMSDCYIGWDRESEIVFTVRDNEQLEEDGKKEEDGMLRDS
ncbi:putative U5 small nuclear ribonucleoprotein 200 kDa helicase [Blattamonas nauphoetae]|uniref:U5 small nuclear ribonucleoprotein 200 kDa helicase n=1 Tax=Blattamonas nauphoetae TaxID=2049346 RepID=A0ABQ9YM63_9EUKA|nr:putative U5 small nuclear ribonucleoprotein 200 kDa helicase [Blattamonas nauphoetae]